MMTLKDAEKILGVSVNASKDEVAKKYNIILKKQKILNNDGQNSHISVPDMKEINKAYNVLMGYDTEDMLEDYEKNESVILKKAGIDEKKLRNFFYYYKYHIIIGLLAVIFIAVTVRDIMNKVDPDFYVVFAGDFYYGDSSQLKEKIKDGVSGIKNPKIESAFINKFTYSSREYNGNMKLAALLAAGDIDVFILDRPNFEQLAEKGAFLSLDGLANRLAIDREKNKLNVVINKDNASENHLYGIDIKDSQFFKNPEVAGKDKIVAIRINTKRKKTAERFVEYLIKG